MNLNNMNSVERFDFLDAITIASLFLQIYNMNDDDNFTKQLKNEIKELHKENQEIIKLLKERKNN